MLSILLFIITIPFWFILIILAGITFPIGGWSEEARESFGELISSPLDILG